MSKHFVAFVLIGCSSLLTGCNTEEAADTPAATDGAQVDDAAVDEIEITEADRQLAMEQGVCPVSGEELGSMGDPIKMMVGDRAVFLCCEHCKADFEADPEKFVAKLDQSEESGDPEADGAEEMTPEPSAAG